MKRGGCRDGAGRKAFCEDAVSVHWRVSENAKAWLKARAVEEGVSIGAVLDNLIRKDEAIEGAVRHAENAMSMANVAEKIQENLSQKIIDAVWKEESLQHDLVELSWEINKLNHCWESGRPARIKGKVVRITKFNVCRDSFDSGTPAQYRVSYETVPMTSYEEKDIIDIDVDKIR